MEKDAYCQELSRYIHLNPVRAGMVNKPEEYSWSSYPFYVGLQKRPVWLTIDTILGYFYKDGPTSRKRYKKFVDNALRPDTENPLKGVFASTFLGSEGFISGAKEKWGGYKNADLRNVPVLKELAKRPSLEQIEQAVDSIMGRENPFLKKFCIYSSHQIRGYNLKEIDSYYDMRGSAASQSSRRFREEILKNKKLKKILSDINQSIGFVEC